jgi:O-antigen/teichoic acid export membrane protein
VRPTRWSGPADHLGPREPRRADPIEPARTPAARDAERLQRSVGGWRALARSAGATLLARVCVLALGVGFLVLLTRFLSLSEYGDYVYLVSLATLFAVAADGGVAAAVGPPVARGEHSARQAMVLALPIAAVTAVLSTAALITFAALTDDQRLNGLSLVVASVFVFLTPLLSLVLCLLRCTGRALVEGLVLATSAAAYAGAGVAAASRGHGVDVLLTLFLGQQMVALVLGGLVLRPSLRRVAGEPPAPPGSRRSLLQTSLVVMLGIVVMAICARLSLLVIARTGTADETGMLAAATRISEVGIMLGMTAGMALLPAIAHISVVRRARARRIVGWSAVSVLLASAAVGGGLAANADGVFATVFGSEYADAATAGALLAVGLPVFVLGPLMLGVLHALGEIRWRLASYAASVLIAIVGAVILVPGGGTAGAALSTLLAFVGLTAVATVGWLVHEGLAGSPGSLPRARRLSVRNAPGLLRSTPAVSRRGRP